MSLEKKEKPPLLTPDSLKINFSSICYRVAELVIYEEFLDDLKIFVENIFQFVNNYCSILLP
jgi:hypothetical protein